MTGRKNLSPVWLRQTTSVPGVVVPVVIAVVFSLPLLASFKYQNPGIDAMSVAFFGMAFMMTMILEWGLFFFTILLASIIGSVVFGL